MHATRIALIGGVAAAVLAVVRWRRAVHADDRLVDDLARGGPVRGGRRDVDVAAHLRAWQAGIDDHPVPDLVTVDVAVARVRRGRRRDDRAG